MSSKTKIVVLHMKEIIYTTVLVVLGILLIILLALMFSSKSKKSASERTKYAPGVYTSTFTINNTNFELEIAVDSSHINAIRFTNLDESITTLYPLVQPTLESIAQQISETQSLDNISYSPENAYTSQVIINAIKDAITKAEVNK